MPSHAFRLVVDLGEVVSLVAERTLDFQRSHASVLQLFGGLGLHDWVGDGVVFVASFGRAMRVVLVLLAVCSQTLSHKVDLNTFDVLDQSGDGRQQLLVNVPIDVDLELVS